MVSSTRVLISPKQSLGQNFLVDENIARNIVSSMMITPDDVVLEIGPGTGALTRHLVHAAKKVIAIEVDGRAVERLRASMSSPNLEILHEDFLMTDVAAWQRRVGQPLRVAGNLPYHLTSPILFKIFDSHSSVTDLTMMIQREVAQRITAEPGTKAYGILTVFSQFYGIPERLFSVSANCFYPKPKVTSTVVRLTLHRKLMYDVDRETFRTVVKTAFGKRRKTLRNSLQYLPFEDSSIRKILDGIDFPLDRRPEQLTLNEFVSLSEQVASLRQSTEDMTHCR